MRTFRSGAVMGQSTEGALLKRHELKGTVPPCMISLAGDALLIVLPIIFILVIAIGFVDVSKVDVVNVGRDGMVSGGQRRTIVVVGLWRKDTVAVRGMVRRRVVVGRDVVGANAIRVIRFS